VSCKSAHPGRSHHMSRWFGSTGNLLDIRRRGRMSALRRRRWRGRRNWPRSRYRVRTLRSRRTGSRRFRPHPSRLLLSIQLRLDHQSWPRRRSRQLLPRRGRFVSPLQLRLDRRSCPRRRSRPRRLCCRHFLVHRPASRACPRSRRSGRVRLRGPEMDGESDARVCQKQRAFRQRQAAEIRGSPSWRRAQTRHSCQAGVRPRQQSRRAPAVGRRR
jgi:hypothetical protein